MATLVNQDGTTGVDTLTYNKAGTYHAKAGSDTINIEGGSGIVVYADSGNNIIKVTGGSGHTVKIAVNNADSDKQNGVDKLTINGANQVDGYLGSGKDIISLTNTDGRTATGALSQLHGGAWGDTFTVNAGAQRYQLYGDAGDDIFNINSGSNIVCWGGAANDTFNVTGDSGIKLRGGDSADVYNITDKAQAVDMQLGYGNDTVNVEAGDKHIVKANLGINTINLKSGSGHKITADIDQAASKKQGYTDEQIKAGQGLGYGVDKVFLEGTATYVTANLGDGKDEVNVSRGYGHKIYTEGWGDTINIAGTVSNSIFDAGAGDDVINVSGGTNNAIATGEGNDVVKITGGSLKVVDLGDGKDHLEFSKGTAEGTIINGGKGSDQLYIYVAGCTVNGDEGYDTIRVNTSLEDTAHSYINGGEGQDYIYLSGRNFHVKAGADKDRVIFTGEVLAANVYLEEGDDKVEANNKAADFYRVYINGGSGDNSITLENKLESCSIIGGEGKDIMLVGYMPEVGDGSDKTGSRNILRGGAGEDNITCKNNEYALIVGDEGADTIKGHYISKSVIYGDLDAGVSGKKYGNDWLEMYNVDHSFICGSDGSAGLVSDDMNNIRLYNCQSNIVFGGALSNELYAYNTKNCLIMSGLWSGNPKDSIRLDENCEYNLYYIGGGDDTVTVYEGKNTHNNTCIASSGANTFNIWGGAFNSFIGGSGKDYYYIRSTVTEYNLLQGDGVGDVYHIDSKAKALIDLTKSAGNVIDITGAKDSEVAIKVDKQNDIMLINDILIKGTSCSFYFGSTTLDTTGGIKLSYSDMLKESTGKAHTEGSLWHIWNTYYDQMGEQGKAVTATDLGPSLDNVLEGTQEKLLKLCAAFEKG